MIEKVFKHIETVTLVSLMTPFMIADACFNRHGVTVDEDDHGGME